MQEAQNQPHILNGEEEQSDRRNANLKNDWLFIYLFYFIANLKLHPKVIFVVCI